MGAVVMSEVLATGNSLGRSLSFWQYLHIFTNQATCALVGQSFSASLPSSTARRNLL